MRLSVWRTLLELLFIGGITILGVQGQMALPVIVQDRLGQPVHDLQAPDFSLQCAKGFSLGSAEEIPPATVSQFRSPVPIYVLYDVLTVPAPKQGAISRSLLSYLRIVASENRAATVVALTDGGLRVIHEMRTAPRVLGAALDLLDSKQVKGNIEQAELARVKEETDRLRLLTQFQPPGHSVAYTPAALQQLKLIAQFAEMLRSSQKRKLLVWLTGPFPVVVDSGELHFDGHAYEEPELAGLKYQYQVAIYSLNASHISVYPIRVPPSSRLDLRDQTDYGLSAFAEATAGRNLGEFDARQFSATLDELTRQPQPYYSLTLRGSSQKSTWVGCKVSVNAPNSRVFAPKGIFANP